MNDASIPGPNTAPDDYHRNRFRALVERIRAEVPRNLVGLEDATELVLVAFFAGGHVLLESVPGLGKTMLARTIASALGLPFGRVQFTPDLMPFDIIGGEKPVASLEGGLPRLEFAKGPVFTSFLLADEVNRAPPKTQAALLEAMAERQVTVPSLRRTLALPVPFFVVATQNPVEMEGTYELPEAQLDRFMLKVRIPHPTEDAFTSLIAQHWNRHQMPVKTHAITSDLFGLPESDPDSLARELMALNHAAQAAMAPFPFSRQVAHLALLTNLRGLSPSEPARRDPSGSLGGLPLDLRREVWGAVQEGISPRAALDLARATQVLALIEGAPMARWAHVRRLAPAVFGHRLRFTFEGASLRRPDAIRDFVERLCDAVAPVDR